MIQAAARHPAGENAVQSDALEYWLAQERVISRADEWLPEPERTALPVNDMPGGWWLLPIMIMSVPTWAVILWLIFG